MQLMQKKNSSLQYFRIPCDNNFEINHSIFVRVNMQSTELQSILVTDFANQYDALETVLAPIKCGSLINKKFEKPIILETQMTVAEAAETLSSHMISSAPVFDPMSNSIEFMFDFRDICVLMMDFLKNENHMSRIRSNINFSFLISDLTIEAAKSLSHVQSFRFCHRDDSLLRAFPVFGSGIHRIAVVDDEGGFLGVISQSDAISCIHKYADSLQSVLSKSLEQLEIARKSIICCGLDTVVLEALGMMQENFISSVGVVDENGSLIGVLSMTDIRHVFREKAFAVLKSTAHDFLAEIRQRYSKVQGKASYPVFAVRPNASLHDVINKLVSTRAHRIYVTVEERPVGVVSLTDILRVCVRQKGSPQ